MRPHHCRVGCHASLPSSSSMFASRLQCSGGCRMLQPCAARPVGAVRRRACPRARMVATASYDFTNAENQRVPGERRNRTLEKRKAKELDVIVAGLTHMTLKQLKAVAHLLQPIPGVMEDIAIAAKLPRSNQGRKRQEDLIAKKMRLYVEEEAMEKLSDAVVLAEDSQALYEDSDIQGLVDEWKEGLLGGEQAAFQQVIDTAAVLEVELTAQQLGQLVRRLQQCMTEERQAAEQEAAEAAAQGTSGSGEDEAPVDAPGPSAPASQAAGAVPSAEPASASTQGSGSGDEGAPGPGSEKDAEFRALLEELADMKPRAKTNKRVRSRGKGGAPGRWTGTESASRRQATQLASNALCQVLRKMAERQVTGSVGAQ